MRQGEAEGWIEIMNHQNPLTGTISEAGEVVLCGEIKTLVDAVPYTATGILRGREISLELNTAYGIYAVAGEEVLPD